MNNHVRSSLILVLLIGLFSSCTLSKRQHQSGFYFSWNSSVQGQSHAFRNTSPNKEKALLKTIVQPQVNNDYLQPHDTILPPSVPPEYKAKEAEPDYSTIPDIQTRMELEADTIIKKSTDNMALFGGVAVASALLLGVPIEWTFVLITVAVVGFVWVIRNAVKTTKRLSKFKRQYSDFSDNKQYKKAMKLGSFNHLLLALAGLILASILVVLVMAALSVPFI
jgi:hypothetical protein